MLRTLLVVLAVALVASTAGARELDVKKVAQTSASQDLKDGLRNYDDLEFETALRNFESALKSQDLSKDETAVAAMYAGIIAHSLNQKDRAKGYFEQAIDAVPDLDLPSDAPPKTQMAFGEAKRTHKAAGATAGSGDKKPETTTRTTTATGDSGAIEGLGTGEETGATRTVEEKKPLYKEWWLWAGVGAAVVATAVVVVLVVNSSGSNPCGGDAAKGCIDVTTPLVRF